MHTVIALNEGMFHTPSLPTLGQMRPPDMPGATKVGSRLGRGVNAEEVDNSMSTDALESVTKWTIPDALRTGSARPPSLTATLPSSS